jgi:hypothetical protein
MFIGLPSAKPQTTCGRMIEKAQPRARLNAFT